MGRVSAVFPEPPFGRASVFREREAAVRSLGSVSEPAG
jgi:hypothetical protein